MISDWKPLPPILPYSKNPAPAAKPRASSATMARICSPSTTWRGMWLRRPRSPPAPKIADPSHSTHGAMTSATSAHPARTYLATPVRRLPTWGVVPRLPTWGVVPSIPPRSAPTRQICSLMLPRMRTLPTSSRRLYLRLQELRLISLVSSAAWVPPGLPTLSHHRVVLCPRRIPSRPTPYLPRSTSLLLPWSALSRKPI